MNEVCKNCAAPLEPGAKFCASCGSVVVPSSASSEATPPPVPASRGRRYPGLRIIALLLKIVAVLTAIGGVITALSAAAITSSLPGYAGLSSPGIGAAGSALGWIIFLVGLCYALFLWASAEMIHVLIDIEENTRRSAASTVHA